MATQELMNEVAVVVIGRNEGERLRRCLESVCGKGVPVVYVDSGSTDGSVNLARSMCCDLLKLDRSRPFSAPRARNEGFAHLVRTKSDAQFVQFVDGDCILAEGWLHTARRELGARPNVAIVCGRLRELQAEASIYKRLAAIEWDRPLGEVKYVGGIFMVRRSTFEETGGFKEMIGGADPELCVRVRQRGWKIIRLDAEMASHDMPTISIRQWWRRAVRTGHAYAEGAVLHGRSPDRHNVRPVLSAAFWGLFMPLAIAGSAVVAVAWNPWAWIAAALMAVAYPLASFRVYRMTKRQGRTSPDALLYAVACLLSKFANVYGILIYVSRRIWRLPFTDIEHKGTTSPSRGGEL